MKPLPFSEVTDFEPAEIEVQENKYIFGIFTINRVDRETLPEGLYRYDIRGGGEAPYETVEPYVGADHMGAFITKEEIPMLIKNENDEYSDIISFGVIDIEHENDWRKPYLND